VNPQEQSVAAIVAAAQDAVAEREEVLREIVAAGWELLDARVGLDEGGIVSSVTASGTYLDPRRPGVEPLIRIWIRLWRDGVMEIEADDPASGISVSIGEREIPTVTEAAETYWRRLRQPGKMITNEYQVFRPRRTEAATR
jgi:hypothetical protein